MIDADQRLIIITGEYADANEWRELLARVFNDPARDAGFGFLRDLREATRPVDAATVVRIIDVVRGFWPLLEPSRAAIVTARPVDNAAMVAQALADAQHLPFQVFNSYEQALDWLREAQ